MFLIFRKVRMQLKNICTIYREGTVNDWMCQKWFAKFYTEGFLWNDDSQSSKLYHLGYVSHFDV